MFSYAAEQDDEVPIKKGNIIDIIAKKQNAMYGAWGCMMLYSRRAGTKGFSCSYHQYHNVSQHHRYNKGMFFTCVWRGDDVAVMSTTLYLIPLFSHIAYYK